MLRSFSPCKSYSAMVLVFRSAVAAIFRGTITGGAQLRNTWLLQFVKYSGTTITAAYIF
jgi:hypothetical protein